jgi:hypothetical protein
VTLNTTNCAALVPGGADSSNKTRKGPAVNPEKAKTLKVVVIRPTWYAFKQYKVGDIIEGPVNDMQFLIGSKKASEDLSLAETFKKKPEEKAKK